MHTVSPSCSVPPNSILLITEGIKLVGKSPYHHEAEVKIAGRLTVVPIKPWNRKKLTGGSLSMKHSLSNQCNGQQFEYINLDHSSYTKGWLYLPDYWLSYCHTLSEGVNNLGYPEKSPMPPPSGIILGRAIKFSYNDPLHSIMRAPKRKDGWIPPNAQPFNMDHAASHANHLIVVAGHSTIISGHLEDAGEDESDWYLLDYQKGQGLPQAIKAHIRAGIEECARDPKSLLVFSGGETRALTGPASEGPSYFHAADAMDMWPQESNVRTRTTTEEFATDSFQNM
eukprot:scaffold25626_cov137-Cylindrotheca_fusiformis.AAC.9